MITNAKDLIQMTVRDFTAIPKDPTSVAESEWAQHESKRKHAVKRFQTHLQPTLVLAALPTIKQKSVHTYLNEVFDGHTSQS